MEDVASSINTLGPEMDLQGLLVIFFNTAMIFSAIIATVFLIYGGFRYMMSGGDSVKTEDAQKSISGVVIGLVVCLSSGLIVKFVLQLLDVDAAWI